ncbi:MAG TPA: hypothetical protein VN457_05410 [Chlamydiales bacterium]|nr:hypothetical protein [Chlamydiales bacterium]
MSASAPVHASAVPVALPSLPVASGPLAAPAAAPGALKVNGPHYSDLVHRKDHIKVEISYSVDTANGRQSFVIGKAILSVQHAKSKGKHKVKKGKHATVKTFTALAMDPALKVAIQKGQVTEAFVQAGIEAAKAKRVK